MTRFVLRGTTAALILAFATKGALADLRAQDVWSDWRDYLAGAGYQITGTETMSGGTLAVTDLSMSMQVPEGQGVVTIHLDRLAFTENGDGTVNVAMPPHMPIRFDLRDDEAEQVEGEIGLTQTGAAMVVSGSPADMTYNYTAARVGVALDGLTVDGEAMPAEAVNLSLALNNVTSSTKLKLDALRNYDQRMNADSLSYEFAFDDPESEDMANFKGAMQGLEFRGTSSVPLKMDTTDFQKMLKDGFSLDGRFTYSAGNSNLVGKGDGEDFTFDSSSQGGSAAMAMDATHLAYDLSQTQSSITMQSAEVPFPISVAMAKTGFALDMPISKSEEEQPFSFAVTIGDFTMPEQLWGIFDPAAILPRDPATFILDVAGKAKVLYDFLDPAIAETLGQTGQPPGELHALTINQLLVSAVGARLSGSGAFTFDNSDLESFDGIPAPSGSASLQLVGANGLIDKLIQMGLMSDDDAMGARMMMGMMAVPGEGEDTLNSTIEINDQGHILANGQRLK